MSKFKITDLIDGKDIDYLKTLRSQLPTSPKCYKWVHKK